MLKHTLIASILALTLTPLAHSKVTYEDAIKDQSAYNAKIKALAPPPAVGYTSDDLAGFEDTAGDWQQIYTGNTTGRVNIPSNAKMIMVQTSSGSVTFPTSIGSATLITSKDFDSNCGGIEATATARFTGTAVAGDSDWNAKSCGSKDNKVTASVNAKITIQKVLIQK